MSVNGLYELFFNGIDLLSINFLPRDVRGLNELSGTAMKIISINIFPPNVRYSVNIMSKIGLPDINFLGS